MRGVSEAVRSGHHALLTLDRAPLLFGRDPTPGILACHLVARGDAMRVWRRRDGNLTAADVAFSPFLLAVDRELIGDPARLVAWSAWRVPVR